jgi:hypothetical protein
MRRTPCHETALEQAEIPFSHTVYDVLIQAGILFPLSGRGSR